MRLYLHGGILGFVYMEYISVSVVLCLVGVHDINFVLNNLTALWEEVEQLRHQVISHRHGDPPHDQVSATVLEAPRPQVHVQWQVSSFTSMAENKASEGRRHSFYVGASR